MSAIDLIHRQQSVVRRPAALGLAALFVAADILAFGKDREFRLAQVSGAVLGILVAAGGLGIYALGRAPG